MLYRGDDARRLAKLADIAAPARVPLIAVNDVLYHAPERRELQDVVTCIREKTTIDKAGKLLDANAERHLKAAARNGAAVPQISRGDRADANVFSTQCNFSLEELRGPNIRKKPARVMRRRRMRWWRLPRKARKRAFRRHADRKSAHALDQELQIIGELELRAVLSSPCMTSCNLRAPDRNILCQGRGSAANSLICYCLGITEVNPEKVDLLFERFVSAERREPPDIDVDFEHERREEVIQYIYETYTAASAPGSPRP